MPLASIFIGEARYFAAMRGYICNPFNVRLKNRLYVRGTSQGIFVKAANFQVCPLQKCFLPGDPLVRARGFNIFCWVCDLIGVYSAVRVR